MMDTTSNDIANPESQSPVQPNAPAPSDDENSSVPNAAADDDEMPKGSVNLQKAFSKINTALIRLADNSGVRRSISLPHVDGETPAQHFAAVGQAAAAVGGLTQNLVLAEHSKHGGADGAVTVGYPAEKLKAVLIPKDDPDAKAAIDATRSFVSKAAKLLGRDNSTVKTAQSQIDLIGAHGAEGVTIHDLIVGLINIPAPLINLVARRHSGTKSGGHHPRLRAPRN